MKSRRSIVALAAIMALSACAAQPTQPFAQAHAADAQNVRVSHFWSAFSEVYLVAAPSGKIALIDTGVPDLRAAGVQGSGGDALVEQIRAAGYDPADISVVVVTHGHGDHAGNARYFQERYGVPVIGGAGDLDKFTRGRTDIARTDREAWGRIGEELAQVSDLAYPPFRPDVLVLQEPVDLSVYGVPGVVYPAPGHTPGSLVAAVGRHLFTGDLIGVAVDFSGDASNPMIRPNGDGAAEFIFVENRLLAREQLRFISRLMDDYRTETVYPTHWGPLSAAQVRDYIGSVAGQTEERPR